MPTPSEKKALGFLAAVAVLGAAVRMSGAVTQATAADASSREALRRQIVAAESAGAVERRGRRTAGNTAFTRRSKGHPVAAITTDSARVADPRDLFNAPPVMPPTRASKPRSPAPPLDLDRATASELEALPRIGPALAKRIIDDRDARGPFGSLEGFQRVRGVGPAMAAALSASVTFSGTPRPSIAGGVRGSGPPGGRSVRHRRAPP
jgi:competence protein ComEA